MPVRRKKKIEAGDGLEEKLMPMVITDLFEPMSGSGEVYVSDEAAATAEMQVRGMKSHGKRVQIRKD